MKLALSPTDVSIGMPQHANMPKYWNAINLLEITGHALIDAAVRQPLDGAMQLCELNVSKPVDEPSYQFNSPEWYAATVGHGLGALVPFLATSKLTGAVWHSAGVGKAVIDGAVAAFVFTPSNAGSPDWSQRALAAIDSGVMFGTQHAISHQLTSKLGSLIDGPASITRFGVSTVSGAVSGMAGLQVSSIVSGNGPLTDRQAMLQSAVAGAATGFALESTNLIRFGQKNLKPDFQRSNDFNSKNLPSFPWSQNVAEPLAPIGRFEPNAEAASTIKEIGSWQNDSITAKEYAKSNGNSFFQTSDGRIIYTWDKDGSTFTRVWTPHSIPRPSSAFTEVNERKIVGSIVTLHEVQGAFLESGRKFYPDIKNDFDNAPPKAVPIELRARLELPLSRVLESEQEAFARILPNSDGQQYTNLSFDFRQQKPGEAPKDLSFEQFEAEWVETKAVPSRLYKILSAEGAHKLATTKFDSPQQAHEQLEKFATNIIVPESYAAQLDRLREVRRFATLNPDLLPERRDEILAARRELFISTHRHDYLPEHWGQFLDNLPNRQLIEHLCLVDWKLASHVGTNPIAAAHRSTKRVEFYLTRNNVEVGVRRTLLHEWAHIAKETDTELLDAYDLALSTELEFAGREYARYSTHEDFAVHMAEMVLDPNPELFLTIAEHSPVRTVIAGEFLRRELNNADEPDNPHVEPFRRRLRYIYEEVLPRAKSKIDDLDRRYRGFTNLKRYLDSINESDYL